MNSLARSTTTARTLGLRAGLAGVLAIPLLGTVVSSTPASGSPPMAITASTAQAARASCVDTLILGIDGNGQGKGQALGKVVRRVAKRIGRTGASQSRAWASARIRVRTAQPRVLVTSPRLATRKALSKPGARTWAKSIRKATKKANQRLAAAAVACPEQQVVLVGYAQGAGAVHTLLGRLDAAGRLDQVAAAVTVADPWRVKASVAGAPLGAPNAPRRSVGVLTRLRDKSVDVPTGPATFRTISVCTRSDLVCHPSKESAKRGLKATRSYATKSGKIVLHQAADVAAAQVAQWPKPIAETISVVQGTPVSHQLKVSGGSVGTPATWTASSLPEGLSLSSTGLLTGTLTAPGSHEVRYTVAGVSPATSAKSGVVTLNVTLKTGVLSAGGMTTCEVREDATAWCWGRNDWGQIGDGTRDLRTSATQVQGAGWRQVDTGGSSTCGVRTDGTLWCWGLNKFGQLGGRDRKTVSTPRQVGTRTDWTSVSSSWTHACATATDGSLWCWGQNLRGQLGTGKVFAASNKPMRVAGGLTWSSVTAGGWHTCGIATNGAGYCWGDNMLGQVGDGTVVRRPAPTPIAGGRSFSQLSANFGRTCGVTTGREAYCWGENSYGELGNGNRLDSLVPVAVIGGAVWTSIAVANTSTCATSTQRRVFCWGDNRYGQLGPASTGLSMSASPADAGLVADQMGTAGWLHQCAVGVSCWGGNELGQLGIGAVTPPGMPAETPPTFTPGPTLSKKQVFKRTPARIARDVLASRPAANARARRAGGTFNVMTFNLLGSQHTSPTGARPAFAPGRLRSEWARELIERREMTLVGLSEPQPDQIVSLDIATKGEFTAFPGNTMGYASAPQSVMWKDSEWEYVWGTTAPMPFMKGVRPQPVVRLRNRQTGSEVYWINAHLSPGGMQRDRDRGTAIIAAMVNLLTPEGLPILVTGDLNEKARAFRRIACKTGMTAAIGGTSINGCTPPSGMRVDWIFGKGGTFANTMVEIGPRVQRTTDHAIVSSRFTVQ